MGRPLLRPGRPSTELERAYAAGFFDGEGSIIIECVHPGMRPSGRYQGEQWRVRTSVSQTSFEVLNELASIWSGHPRPYQPKGNAQPAWDWRLKGRIVVMRFLAEILPYLKVKAPQATLALDWLRLSCERRVAVAAATKEVLGNLNARGAAAAMRRCTVPLFEPSPQLELLEEA